MMVPWMLVNPINKVVPDLGSSIVEEIKDLSFSH